MISIHAPLAESDQRAAAGRPHVGHFYPRSPCGERPIPAPAAAVMLTFLSTLSLRRATSGSTLLAEDQRFLSTLSLRRATGRCHTPAGTRHISIHALLAESDATRRPIFPPWPTFLSTLSLRRATLSGAAQSLRFFYFYPRSPCGERQVVHGNGGLAGSISIHALLAESDANGYHLITP